MRAVVATRRGGPEVLCVQCVPEPVPAAGEVLVDVRAAGVSFSEVLARVGLYPNAPDLPAVLGYEVAGTVATVGRDVTSVTAGDRVLAFVRHAGYAERAVAREADVLRLPPAMEFEQGAAVPLAFATAYGALFRYGACQAGERVLIHAAAGGVGSSAVQLARLHGLEVWGTASPRKHDALRRLGVDHPVDYTSRGWERELPGMDLVMDALGGASFRRSYELLRAGGRLVCFGASGVLSGERRSLVGAARTILRTPRFNPMKQMTRSRAVIGLDTIAIWTEKGSLEELLAPLQPLLDAGRLEPTVAATFSFDRAPEAHRILTDRANVGKVVLVP